MKIYLKYFKNVKCSVDHARIVPKFRNYVNIEPNDGAYGDYMFTSDTVQAHFNKHYIVTMMSKDFSFLSQRRDRYLTPSELRRKRWLQDNVCEICYGWGDRWNVEFCMDLKGTEEEHFLCWGEYYL